MSKLHLGQAKLNFGADDMAAFSAFCRLKHHFSPAPCIALESRSADEIYGRMSLFGVDPTLEIVTQGDETLIIRQLQNRGKAAFQAACEALEDFSCAKPSATEARFCIPPIRTLPDKEEDRTRRQNVVCALRPVLASLQKILGNAYPAGLFGGFSFGMAHLFEDIPRRLPKSEAPIMHLFFFDTFLRVDLLRERTTAMAFRQHEGQAKADAQQLADIAQQTNSTSAPAHFRAGDFAADTNKKEFAQLVERAQQLCKEGELFEVVFSREFSADFDGDALGLYAQYRLKNPAPYMFFVDFGNQEYLVGASPEMMVRAEEGKVHLRPISGTRPRGKDEITDHENMMELLSSPKERAELDMLVDLGRNDLRRVCKSGIKLQKYRVVERYSRVMHTIAHLTGELREDADALDALCACLPAGTLAGAPKVRALQAIEEHEQSPRGWYGGAVGYLALGGQMDTGIIIRTAHIRQNKVSLRVGATLLHGCTPQGEYQETENKARAFLELFSAP